MKSKQKELDVDFIGGQGPLTKEEEKQISEYLKSKKVLNGKTGRRGTKGSAKRKKFIA